jgi:peptide/nickel transport system permease protein
VINRHAVPNALLPLVTLSAIQFGAVAGGAITIETVFSWPGLGRLIVQAVPGRDFPVIQAGVFVFALIFVVLNFLVDLLYAAVDPRIRLQ